MLTKGEIKMLIYYIRFYINETVIDFDEDYSYEGDLIKKLEAMKNEQSNHTP
jgi:hypothetical protein